MPKCVNNNCDKDPFQSDERTLANTDGDFACNEECKKEYEKQRDRFFKNIGNDEWYNNYMYGEESF